MVAPSSATFQRPDLGSAFQEFDLVAAQAGYVGLQIYTPFESALQTANFSVIPVEQLLQQRETLRAPGAGYSRGTYTFEQANFACEEHGAEEPVGDRERNIYAYSFDVERVAAERAVNFVLRQHEQQVADAIMDTGTISNTAATAVWSNNSTGRPVDDVIAALNSIRTQSGLMGNCVVMDLSLFRHLQTSDQILDRIKYTGGNADPAHVNAQALAAVFGVEKVIIAGGVKNTAAQGQAASLGAIFDGAKCFVGKIATGADLRDPCIGRTFLNTNDGAGSLVIEQYRAEDRRADIIRARLDFDVKTIYAAAGHIVTGCV